MEFNYQIEEKKDYNLVSISGNLIEKNQASHLLEEINELVEKESNKFILNMQDFKYMNSTGLTILLNILTKARKSGGEAVICNVPDRIKSLLVITKLNNVFSVVDSEALAAQNLN
jgi:anti-sigma B factor antagonist